MKTMRHTRFNYKEEITSDKLRWEKRALYRMHVWIESWYISDLWLNHQSLISAQSGMVRLIF